MTIDESIERLKTLLTPPPGADKHDLMLAECLAIGLDLLRGLLKDIHNIATP